MSQLLTAPTADVHRHPLNPRRPVTDAGDLVGSVASHGILSPLTVITDPDGGYLLIAGERRLTAAKANGLVEVPVMLRDDLDNLAAVEALVMDNLQRQDLTPAEEAEGYKNLLDLGLDPATIAKRVGRPVKHVEDHAKASALNPGAIEVLHQHVVTLDQALSLAELDDAPDLMDATLAKLSKGGNATQIIQDALTTRRNAKRRQEVEDYASANGVRFLEPREYDYSKCKDLGNDKKALKAHAKLDCYRVTVRTWGDAPVLHICTAPRSHKDADPQAPAMSVDDKAEQSEVRRLVIANNKRFEAMNTIRREWLVTFTQRTTAPKVYLPDLVALMARHSPSSHLAARTYGSDALDMATLTTTRAAMVLIAAVCEEVESTIDKGMWRRADRHVARYLTALASWGYPLTDPERNYVDACAANTDPASLDYTADNA
jgi:ParB family chromosome partitioning protein